MTNEEKTNKICCKNCTLKSFCKKKGRCDMYKSVLKMAVWKDQQFAKNRYIKEQLRLIGIL